MLRLYSGFIQCGSALLSLIHRFQLLGCVLDDVGFMLKHLADGLCSLFRLRPFLLLDRFANRRNRLHAISGVGARRVYLVFEPWTLGQALLVEKRAFGFEQLLVQLLHRSV